MSWPSTDRTYVSRNRAVTRSATNVYRKICPNAATTVAIPTHTKSSTSAVLRPSAALMLLITEPMISANALLDAPFAAAQIDPTTRSALSSGVA